MWQICIKELKQFFSSLAGFLAVGLFLLIMGLVLFVLPTTKSIDFNIFEYGFASLEKYFSLTPWILMLLIPSICMRLFADEYKQGTFELLITKPIGITKIVVGKWLGGFCVGIIALVPTVIYMFCIKALAYNNHVDSGAIWGSYIGLFCLAASFTAISLWASSLTTNYIVSFLLGAFINFFIYVGFGIVSKLQFWGNGVSSMVYALGMQGHYDNVSQGLLAVKDIFYFIIITGIFLFATYKNIIVKVNNNISKTIKLQLLTAIIGAVFIIVLSAFYLTQGADLTTNKRFSLTNGTTNFLSQNNKAIEVKILFRGNMPPELKRLKESLGYFLKECKNNSNAAFSFNYINIDDANEDSTVNKYINFAFKNGLKPISLQLEKGSDGTQLTKIIPGAIVISGNRAVVVDLFKDAIGKGGVQNANGIFAGISKAEALLEYKFSQAFYKTTTNAEATVAISVGNGEPINEHAANLLTITENYFSNKAFVALNIVNGIPSNINTLIINNPTTAFTDKAKINIDQFLMRGGNILIGFNTLFASMDSLVNTKNGFAAFAINTGLTDLLFSYGIRVNADIVQAKYCDSIPLQVGEINGQPQYNLFGFSYFPILQGNKNSVISNSINNVSTEFGSSIDTLPTKGTNKTILLTTNGASRKVGSPVLINFNDGNVDVLTNKLTSNNVAMGVLVEGNFKSFYGLRTTKALNDSVTAWTGNGLLTESNKPGKIIVVSDGEIFNNYVDENEEKKAIIPLQMGYNKFTGKQYDNPDFFDNCLLYFTGTKNGLAIKESKNKAFVVSYLDPVKLTAEVNLGSAFSFTKKGLWQFICVIIPTLIIGFGIVFYNFLRKRKYTKAI